MLIQEPCSAKLAQTLLIKLYQILRTEFLISAFDETI